MQGSETERTSMAGSTAVQLSMLEYPGGVSCEQAIVFWTYARKLASITCDILFICSGHDDNSNSCNDDGSN